LKHPFLIGERLYLRPIEESDFPNYFDWLQDQETLKYQQHGLYPNTLANMKSYADSMSPGSITNTYRENMYLAICIIETDEHIGNISFKIGSAAFRYSELSIMFGKKENRGKGYGTEAIRLMSDHAFRKVNVNRIQAGMMKDNIACVRAFEKAGFIHESNERGACELYYTDGHFGDCIMMSKVKKDWLREQRQKDIKECRRQFVEAYENYTDIALDLDRWRGKEPAPKTFQGLNSPWPEPETFKKRYGFDDNIEPDGKEVK